MSTYNTLIASLDLSNHPNLENLTAYDGQLTSLNLKNGNNANLEFVQVTDNPCLKCIQVDNVSNAENNMNWVKDADAQYAIDCSFLIDSEPNDTFSDAIYLAPNIDHDGRVGYFEDNSLDNQDFYELSTDFNGALSISFTTPMPPNSAELFYFFDANYATIGTINTNVNNEILSINFDCAAEGESYILNIFSNECLAYQFNYTNTLTVDNNENEPNNTIDDAEAIESSEFISGQIGYGQPNNNDTSDFYQIALLENAPLEIDVALENIVRLRLYQDGSVVKTEVQEEVTAPIEKFTYNNINSSLSYHLEVTLEEGCRDYELLGWRQGFVGSSDTEPNNSKTQAASINIEQSYEGRLSFVGATPDTQDFYTFSLLEANEVLFILNAYEGLVNTAVLTIFDSSGNQMFQLSHDGINSSRTSNTVNLSTGSYVLVISGTDDTGSYDFEVAPQGTLSVQEAVPKDVLSLYPNPSSDKLFFKSNVKISGLKIIDLMGKVVSIQNNPNDFIEVNELVNGVYFIQFSTENNLITKRFIKK